MLMEQAWDLQAIVGACSTSPMTTTTTMDDYSVSYFNRTTGSLMMNNNHINDVQDYISDDYDVFSHHPACSDLYETSITRAALKELEDELCNKPFSNSFQQPIISSPSKVVPNFSITSNSTPYLGESSQQLQQQQQQQQQQQLQQQQQQQLQYPSLAALSTTTAATTTTTKFGRTHSLPPRLKKRKIQPKRVVLHVPVEGLSSDMWAWRKYGQKPIKGSPYPRGYYRCSSSKGCMAKKLVERSFSDPAMFVITYKAEHNHPQPTHRNSLAGSTRNKLISATSTTVTTPASMASSSSMEENNKVMLQPKEESREENDFDDHLVRSIDDLFMGLEVFTGPTNITTSDSAYSHLGF